MRFAKMVSVGKMSRSFSVAFDNMPQVEHQRQYVCAPQMQKERGLAALFS